MLGLWLLAVEIAVTTSGGKPPTVSGTATVDAPGEAVWERLSDLTAWDGMFRDVKSLEVVARDGNRLRVSLDLESVPYGAQEYRAIVDPQSRTISLEIAKHGLDSSMSFGVAPLVDGGARITHSMKTRVSGPAFWLVSPRKLKREQEACVRAYLEDVAVASKQD